MAAEVVVVVENQDPGGGHSRPVKVRRCESADASADNDEIVGLSGVGRRRRAGEEPAVAQRVRHLVGAVVAAAHAGQRRRIVPGIVLRELGGRLRIEAGQPRTGDKTAHADREPVQKVASRDRAVHAELAVTDRIALIIECHKSPRTLVCHTLS